MGIKHRIRRWLWSDDDPQVDVSMGNDAASGLLRGTPMAAIICPISNGYIMRVETSSGDPSAYKESRSILIYCADAKAVSEAIIAHNAKVKLNIEPTQGELFPTTNPAAQHAMQAKRSV